MNYIFDLDELTAAELRLPGIETAQYSVHAIGLVFDPQLKTVYLADPNGPLLKGGSTELLSIPFKKLPRGIKPSTSVSAWDRQPQPTKRSADDSPPRTHDTSRQRQHEP